MSLLKEQARHAVLPGKPNESLLTARCLRGGGGGSAPAHGQEIFFGLGPTRHSGTRYHVVLWIKRARVGIGRQGIHRTVLVASAKGSASPPREEMTGWAQNPSKRSSSATAREKADRQSTRDRGTLARAYYDLTACHRLPRKWNSSRGSRPMRYEKHESNRGLLAG